MPHATLSNLRPLYLPSGEHVRAASAIRRRDDTYIVVQDDVHALVFLSLDFQPRSIQWLRPGPRGEFTFEEASGNKASKMDLEAAVLLPGNIFVAFGSGSTAARETIVTVDPDGIVEYHEAHAFYEALRSHPNFCSGALNLEGATSDDQYLWLFHRANGKEAASRGIKNTTLRLRISDFLSSLQTGAVHGDTYQLDLGDRDGVPYTVTDAVWTPDGIILLAAAEDSADSYADGEIGGSLLARWDPDTEQLELYPLQSERPLKLEGIERLGDATDTFVVVADMDDPASPALLGVVRIPIGRAGA